MAKQSPGESSRGASAAGERKKRPIWLAALAALVTFLAIYGLWARESSTQDAASATEPGGLMPAAQSEGTPLVSVGRTSGLERPCTAWLLDAGASPDTKAYAVTAGSCLGIESPTTVLTGKDLDDAKVEFHAFAPLTAAASVSLVEAPITEVIWASRRGTDLAILRLGATYGDLAKRGLTPLRPIDGPAEDGEILVASVPVEGVPQDQQYLRGSRCRADRTADVLEGGLAFDDFWVSSCKGMLGGSEGAPAFNQPGQVVGMVATTTIGAEQSHPCAVDRPCEVDDGKAKVATDTTYLAPVGDLADCFVNGELRLDGTCSLEDPAGVVAAVAERGVAKPGASVQITPGGDGSGGASDGAAPPEVVAGPAGTLACSDATSWKDVQEASDELVGPGRGSGLATVTLPESEGFTMVCVGSPKQATPVVLEADGTPPDPARIELRREDVEGGVRVEPVTDPPDLSTFRWTSGPSGSIDCATDEGYVDYSGTPSFIEAADLPTTICIVASDAAGNASSGTGVEVK